jgi:ABC-2 type transport system permease protein
MIEALRSEWIKLTTITSTWVLVIIAVAFPIVIGVLTGLLADDFVSGRDLADEIGGTSVVSSMLFGVAATIGITSEFGHNTIRPTFAAMPDRMRPLLAKPIVTAPLAGLLTVGVVIVCWVVTSSLLDGEQSLSDDGVRPALAGAVLLAVGLTLLGYGLGLLVRNAALAICILLLWPLVAELLIAGLLTAAGAESLHKWLPYIAGINMASTDPDPMLLGRVAGGLYFFAWVLAIGALGLVLTRRRDA